MNFSSIGIVAALTLFLSTAVYAQSIEGFRKRFDLLTNSNGDVVRIVDRTLTRKKARKMKDIVSDMRDVFHTLNQDKYNYAPLVRELVAELEAADLEDKGKRPDYEKEINGMFETMKIIDFDEIANDPKFQKAVKFLDKKINEIDRLAFQTVANLGNSSYFWRKDLVRFAANEAIDYALGLVPVSLVFDTFKYLAKRYVKFYSQAREYHQNILFYYLEGFTPEQLGLNQLEWQRGISSLMEANISWYEVFDHRNAVKNWDTYGLERLSRVKARGKKRLERHSDMYSSATRKIGSYFIEVDKGEGRTMVYNFFDRRSWFNSKPSRAYDSKFPNRIKNKRIFYEVVKFGMVFSPVPFSKTIVKQFVNKYYKKQMKREGALFGYYEASGQKELKELMRKQSINPLERRYRLPQD